MKKFLRLIIMVACLAVFCYSGFQLYKIYAEYQEGDEEYDTVLDQVGAGSTIIPTLPAKTELPEDKADGSGESGSADTDSATAADNANEADSKNEGGASGSDEDSESDENSGSAITVVDFKELKKVNADAIAWISIPGTAVDYPVLKSKDNNDYLRHTITGKYNKAGCIFVECTTKIAFDDVNTIIYGHNLLNGKMFSCLTKYQKKNYYLKHPYIYVQTPDGILYYEIYSCYKANADDAVYTNGFTLGSKEYETYLKTTVSNSIYKTGVAVTKDDRIITLSTCTNSKSNEDERFVVQAVLMK